MAVAIVFSVSTISYLRIEFEIEQIPVLNVNKLVWHCKRYVGVEWQHSQWALLRMGFTFSLMNSSRKTLRRLNEVESFLFGVFLKQWRKFSVTRNLNKTTSLAQLSKVEAIVLYFQASISPMKWTFKGLSSFTKALRPNIWANRNR